MFSIFRPSLSRNLAIDLGTANTLIYQQGRGLVLNEPSFVAVKTGSEPQAKKTLIAVGHAAKAIQGKAHSQIEVIQPLKDGVIADFSLTQQMLQHFIQEVQRRRFFYAKPRTIICVPSGSTQVERRAIQESALGAGAAEVLLIEEPMAAAMGAGLPVSDATGSMVVDIGGGTTEIGIVSLGGLVYKQSIRVGGNTFDEAIMQFIRRNYGMWIGETTAEHIKNTIATAYPGGQIQDITVKGHKLSEGLPREFTISSQEILVPLTDPLQQIVSAVKTALELTPPELGVDIAERGIVLTGGGALLNQLDRLLAEETGLPVLVAEDPHGCVVRGCGMALDHLDKWRGGLLST